MNRDNNLIWENWVLRGGINDINEDDDPMGTGPDSSTQGRWGPDYPHADPKNSPGGNWNNPEDLMNMFTMAVNEEEADSSLMDIWDMANDLMTKFKVPREHLEGIMTRSGTMDEEEINSILDPNSELGGDNVHGSGLKG